MGFRPDDERLRNALEIAEREGLDYTFEKTTLADDAHPNTVRITLERGDRHAVMIGSSLGAGRVLVTEIDGYPVEVTGNYHTIVLVAEDVKGSVARIATHPRRGRPQHRDAAAHAESARRRRVHGHRDRRRARRGGARRDPRAALGALGLPPRQGECLMYKSLADAIRDAESQRHPASRGSRWRPRAGDQGRPVDDIRAALQRALDVMRGAVGQGMTGDLYSASGLVGGDAAKLRTGPAGPLAGTPFRDILARALAVQEVNAAMGVIVAAPTAGGAGVLPAVLTGLAARARTSPTTAVVDALAVAGLIGAVIAERASLSGAEGGCQAETGAAAAMAAGAATEMLGGTPAQVGHAVALALQGTLGLVCDPLGGLVELPCVFRNATGVGHRARRHRDGDGRHRVRDPGGRGDRHDGRDRPRDGRALSRDRRRRARRDAHRAAARQGATGADQAGAEVAGSAGRAGRRKPSLPGGAPVACAASATPAETRRASIP